MGGTLYYPTRQSNADVLVPAEILMEFEGNKYNGEDQVIQVLKEKQKYTEDVTSDTFRKKIEARLFTTPVMLWSEVKKRAAINPQWQWHRRDALDAIKDDLVHKEVWREDGGGYADRSPPPPTTTSVQIQERTRNDDTGEVELKVIPVHGDTVYAEIGGEATAASMKVENGLLISDEMEVSFLAVDSSGTHPQGPAQTWKNRVTLKYRLFSGPAGQKMLELKAAARQRRPDGGPLHHRWLGPQAQWRHLRQPGGDRQGNAGGPGRGGMRRHSVGRAQHPHKLGTARSRHQADRSGQTACLEAAARMRHHPGVLRVHGPVEAA